MEKLASPDILSLETVCDVLQKAWNELLTPTPVSRARMLGLRNAMNWTRQAPSKVRTAATPSPATSSQLSNLIL